MISVNLKLNVEKYKINKIMDANHNNPTRDGNRNYGWKVVSGEYIYMEESID